MKKSKYFIFILTFILIGLFALKTTQTQAAIETLITIGSDKYNITITSETEVSDIVEVLGDAKLVTDSAFGGKAYTFYTDDNYSNYLYIETSESGKIVSYGSIDETFKTDHGSYGDDYSPYAYTLSRLRGYYYAKNSKILGIMSYNVHALDFSPSICEQKTAEFYVNTYLSDPVKYLKGLSEQSILMFNALAKKLGKDGKIEFNEEYFYINEQLKEFSSSIRDYAYATKKTSDYAYPIKATDNFEIDKRYYLLNPLLYAVNADNSLLDVEEFKTKNIGVFDYDVNKKKFTLITINKDIFKEFKEVSLTTEEKSKLAAGREEYQKAITNLNKESKLYLTTPKTDIAEELFAGELVPSKKQGITDYVNAIRVGGGLPKLSVGVDNFNVAQHMAVLSTYRYAELGQEIQHLPSKPTGVTDAFYKTAVSWEMAMSENIGRQASLVNMDKVTASDMLNTINIFLDDSTEVGGIFFSHRNKLLGPTVSKFGYGISPYIYVNEFSDVIDTDIPLVAWPANGITFLESLKNSSFYWNAKFYNRYEVTSKTTAKIKNLRTDKTWEFNSEEAKSFHRWYQINDGTHENEIVMYDDTINPVAGDVFEITLSNVYDTETLQNVTYTYRTAFQYFDPDNNPSNIKTLKIQVPDSVTKVGNDYYVGLNEEVKLSAIIDNNDATEKVLTWESSNPNLISITQNGLIKVLQESKNPVTITVKNNHTNLTDTITIIPDTYEEMSLNYSRYQFNSLNESINVKATLNTGKSADVTWSVLNDVVSVKDGIVTPLKGGYTEVYAESPKYGKEQVEIYVAVPVTLSDGRKLYVGDVDGDGAFSMDDASMIEDFANNGTSIDMLKVADVNGDGKVDSKDSSIILDFLLLGSDVFHPGPYKPIQEVTLSKNNLTMDIGDITDLIATINPEDTTDSPILTWRSSNSRVATVENGKITAKEDGVTTITVETSNHQKATCRVTVGTGVSNYLKGDLDFNGKIEVLDAVEALYYYTEFKDINDDVIKVGDFNDNNQIDISDAVEILMLYTNES